MAKKTIGPERRAQQPSYFKGGDRPERGRMIFGKEPDFKKAKTEWVDVVPALSDDTTPEAIASAQRADVKRVMDWLNGDRDLISDALDLDHWTVERRMMEIRGATPAEAKERAKPLVLASKLVGAREQSKSINLKPRSHELLVPRIVELMRALGPLTGKRIAELTGKAASHVSKALGDRRFKCLGWKKNSKPYYLKDSHVEPAPQPEPDARGGQEPPAQAPRRPQAAGKEPSRAEKVGRATQSKGHRRRKSPH